MKKAHLTLEDRLDISQMLSAGQSFKQISIALAKSSSSISREVKNHLVFRKTGGYGRAFNACKNRQDCSFQALCSNCIAHNKKHCCFCEKCNTHCYDFEEQKCHKLSKPPYVCNGCPDKNRCTLEKHFYNASVANNEYLEILSESRSGISYLEDEIKHLDSIVSPLIIKGQSLNNICANNKDSIMISESTLYRLKNKRKSSPNFFQKSQLLYCIYFEKVAFTLKINPLIFLGLIKFNVKSPTSSC